MKRIHQPSIDTDNYLGELVEPLLTSRALNRLERISFLGILSPRYAYIANTPIYKRASVKRITVGEDGSRADHSIGVALLAVRICRDLRLSEEEQKYAAAWGLLHDLGNWPLSHSTQHAFSELLGVNTKTVREWLLTSDSRVPKKYAMAENLLACGIEPDRLVRLFQKTPDRDLQTVSSIFRSKLTPDMLEGIWRSGKTFGLQKFNPDRFCSAWYHDLADDFVLRADYLYDAECFWRAKREIYSRFFSSKSAVQFESRWSWAIYNFFRNCKLDLEQSLDLDEAWLVKTVSKYVPKQTNSISRWKLPLRQRISTPYPRTLTLQAFDKIFLEESISVDEYK